MKPDSRKDAMEVDACLQEEEGVAAEHDREKDPACDGGKDPFADNHELQEQPGAIKASAALFQLCMFAIICLTAPSRDLQLGC